MAEMSDLVEIKTSIAEIKGEMRALTEAMRSGDRDSVSGVRLLSQTVDNLMQTMKDQREDLKTALAKFDDRTEAFRDLSATQANAVRLDLQRQLAEHMDADAPHPKTLGTRLDAVERRINLALGGAGLLLIVGIGNVVTVLSQR